MTAGAAGTAVYVLIPTRNRTCALAVTLAALSAQTVRPARIIASDQSDGEGPFVTAEHAALARYLDAAGSSSSPCAICRAAAWQSSARSCFPSSRRRIACFSTMM